MLSLDKQRDLGGAIPVSWKGEWAPVEWLPLLPHAVAIALSSEWPVTRKWPYSQELTSYVFPSLVKTIISGKGSRLTFR